MEEDNKGIEELIRDALTQSGKPFTEQDVKNVTATYLEDDSTLFDDMAALLKKKFTLKDKMELKRGYNIPLSFKETLAIGESRQNQFKADTRNSESTAQGPFQITRTNHEDAVKKIYGADWNTFQKDADMQEKYMDILEKDYDRALPKFKKYAYAKDQKFTDEQIKAGIHYFGIGDAQTFFQSGTLPAERASRIKGFNQLSETFTNERKNFGAPKNLAGQYGLLPEQQEAIQHAQAVDISKIVESNNAAIAKGVATTELLKSKAAPKTKIINYINDGIKVVSETEKAFQDVNQKEKDAQGGILSAVGNFVYDNLLRSQGPSGIVAATKRTVEKDIVTKRKFEEIKQEKAAIFDSLPSLPTPVDYKDIAEAELKSPEVSSVLAGGIPQPIVTAQSPEDAYNAATKRLNDHTKLMRETVDHFKSKLTVEEQQIADNLNNLAPDFFSSYKMSPEMEKFLQAQDNLNQQLKLNDQNVSKYTPLVEESMKAILNARQNGEDPKVAFNNIVGKYTADNPIDRAAIDKIKDQVNDFIDTSEPAVGVPVAEWLQETLYKVGGSLSAMGEGIAEPFKKFFRVASPDTRFSAAEFDALSADDAKRKIMDIVATNPKDAATADLVEDQVKVGNRIVVLKNGQPDHLKDATTGKVIYYQTKQDDQLLLEFAKDPEEYIKKNNLKKETDFRWDVLWNQGGQIGSDMLPMIAASAVTGGSTLGLMSGSALVSYGDYYEEARAQGKNITDASLYAGLTAGLIAIVESKIGKTEQLLGRALSGAEKNAIYNGIKEFSKKEASRGALKSTLERGYLQRAQDFMTAGVPIYKETGMEVVEEGSNFFVEAATQGALGLEVKKPTESDLINTFGLTIFTSTGMGLLGGGASMDKKNITDLVGLAVNNREGFKEISANWIQAAKDKKLGDAEVKRREDEVARKTKIINTVGEYYDYIKEESEGRKMKDEKKSEIMDLAEQKAMVDYEIDKATSQIRKDKLALKSQEIQKELDKLVYDGTDIATEEETAEEKKEAAPTTKKDTETKTQENAVQEQKTTEVPVQPKTESSGTDTQGQPQSEPKGTAQQGKTQEQAQGEEVTNAEEFNDVEIISDYSETPVTYKGESGTLRKDGQTWTVETPTTIYDLDGVGDDTTLSAAGVQIADKITPNEDGSFSIRGKEFSNMFSDPMSAITLNEDGSYTVRLDTKGDNPKPRNFRGQLAEDLAYQITLQKITKEDAKGFEEYINNADANGEIPSPVSETKVGTNAEVPKAKKQRVKNAPESTQPIEQVVESTQGENVAPTQPESAQKVNVLADFEVTTTKGTAAPRTYTKNSNGKWIAQTKKEDGTLSKGVPVSSANVIAQLDAESSKRAAETAAQPTVQETPAFTKSEQAPVSEQVFTYPNGRTTPAVVKDGKWFLPETGAKNEDGSFAGTFASDAQVKQLNEKFGTADKVAAQPKVQSNQQSQQDVETKKADIERRRQEELEKIVNKIFPNTTIKQVVYHATIYDFDKFDSNKLGTTTGNYGFQGKGFYFYKKANDAKTFIDSTLKTNSKVMSVIVNSIHPFTNTKLEAEQIGYKYNPDVAMYTGMGNKEKAKKFSNTLEQEGFDSVIDGEELNVFKPEQIHILTSSEVSEINKINSKYDAELSALKQQPAAQTTTTKTKDKETTTTPTPIQTELENIGKTPKAIQEQIYKFFTSKIPGLPEDKARELAVSTYVMWDSIGRTLGGAKGIDFIQKKLAQIGQISTAKEATKMAKDAGGSVKFQFVQRLLTKDQEESKANAEELLAKGVDRDEVFSLTGWYKTDAADLVYEIENTKINKNFIGAFNDSGKLDDGESKAYPITDLVEGSLFDLYPELKDFKIIFYGDKVDNKEGGYADFTDKEIGIRYNGAKSVAGLEAGVELRDEDGTPEQLLGALVTHELQHALQFLDGRNTAANVDTGLERVKEEIEADLEKRGVLKGLSKSEQASRVADELQLRYGDERTAGYLKYRTLPAESEARVTQNRQAEGRTGRTFSVTEDYIKDREAVYTEIISKSIDRNQLGNATAILEQAKQDTNVSKTKVNELTKIVDKGVKFQQDSTDPSLIAIEAEKINNAAITHLTELIERGDKMAAAEKNPKKKKEIQDSVKSFKQSKILLERARKDPKFSVDAYHGTPYIFDKFTTEKIGTGEGAQAFGWGMYFTDVKSIANYYANKLARREIYSNDKKLNDLLPKWRYLFSVEGDRIYTMNADYHLDDNRDTLKRAREELKNFKPDDRWKRMLKRSLLSDIESLENNISLYERVLSNPDVSGQDYIDNLKITLDNYKFNLADLNNSLNNFDKYVEEEIKIEKDNIRSRIKDLETFEKEVGYIVSNEDKLLVKKDRNIYKVSLHEGKTPDQYNWLEWGKELSQKQIQDLLDKDLDGTVAEALTNHYSEFNDIATTKELVTTMYNDGVTGKDLYKILERNVGENPSPKYASISLLNSGIDGIKYPAESISRGATADTARGSNYVVFDENAVTIKERIQFQQDAARFRAAAIDLGNNTFILAALQDPTITSPSHEFFHAAIEGVMTPEEQQAFIEEYNKEFGDKATSWSTDVSEYTARTYEKYLSNGRKLTEAEVSNKKTRDKLQKAFDNFTEWAKNLYNSVIEYNNSKGVTKPINLTPQAQAFFDRVTGINSQAKSQTDENIGTSKSESKTSEEGKMDTPLDKEQGRKESGTEEEVGEDEEAPSDKILGKKYARYIERALASPGISEEFKAALLEKAVPKVPISDEVTRSFAKAFVSELKTEKEMADAVEKLVNSFTAKINNPDKVTALATGVWEIEAIKQINKKLNDTFGEKTATDVFNRLSGIFSALGSALRLAGVADPATLAISNFSRHNTMEAHLFDAPTFEGSEVTHRQVAEDLIKIYDEAVQEQKDALKAKIAQDIKNQKIKDAAAPKVETKEASNADAKSAKIDLVKRLNTKADEYLSRFRSRSTGFQSGFDIEALTDYALYLYYKTAGSIVKTKRMFESKFGKDVTNTNWDKITSSDEFNNATQDIAREKLLAAINKSGQPNEYTGTETSNRTPAQMVIQSIVHHLTKKEKRPAAAKSIKEIIDNKTLDIATVSDLRRDIASGLLDLEEDARAEMLNQVDDLLATLVKDKADTTANPWLKKTYIRSQVRESLTALEKTIDDLIDDVTNKDLITDTISTEFITRTGMTAEEAAPYIKIIQDNIESFINEKVKARAEKKLLDSYGRNLITLKEAVDIQKNVFESSKSMLDKKKVELNAALRDKTIPTEKIKELQQEVKDLQARAMESKKKMEAYQKRLASGKKMLEMKAKSKAFNKQPSIERIGEIVRNGGLSEETIRQPFAEALGARVFTQSDAEKLRQLYERLDSAAFAIDKKEAYDAISRFAFHIKSDVDRKIFVDLFESYMYANMLGSPKTAEVALGAGSAIFFFQEATSLGWQIAKDIADIVIKGDVDFKNTRVMVGAAKNSWDNTKMSGQGFWDIASGKEGLTLTDMAEGTQGRAVNSLNNMDTLRALRARALREGRTNAAKWYKLQMYHQVMSRGLIIADYVVSSIVLPYKLYRNLADQSRQELKDAGLFNPKYTEIIDKVQGKMKIDEVEQQLAIEKFDKSKDSKAYNHRRAQILYEFLEDSDKQSLIQAEDAVRRLTMTGRVAGYSGRVIGEINKGFNTVSNWGAKDGERNLTAMISASVSKLMLTPFTGMTFKVIQATKNYTPFGTFQPNRREGESGWQWFTDYNYYDVNKKTWQSVPASQHERETRWISATLPTIVGMYIFASAFDWEEDELVIDKDYPYFFTTGYSPAMAKKLAAQNVTYEPYNRYKTSPDGTIERIGPYRDYPFMWPLAVVGRLQEKIMFDQEEPMSSNPQEAPPPNDPLTGMEAFLAGTRSVLAYSTQGSLSNAGTGALAVLTSLEGGNVDGYNLKKLLASLTRQAIPISALQADLDNYYSILQQEARKKGTSFIGDVTDKMLLTSHLVDNTEFDVLGEDVIQKPYGPVITTLFTRATEALGHWLKGEPKLRYPDARKIFTKYKDIDKIKVFTFKPVEKQDFGQTVVEAPDDEQLTYDLKKEAANMKGTLLQESYDTLDNMPKMDLEKELDSINQDVNEQVRVKYAVSVLDKYGYDHPTITKTKQLNEYMINTGLFINSEGKIEFRDYLEKYNR
jgi:hypothetical protein